ncbi:MAG: family 20 glycosylhydrolase, partial [Chthoniobacterales bacterium]
MTQSFQKIGFHIDLRVQAMPIQALRRQAKELAAMGYNTLMVEWEGTYPFKKHAVISNKYSYTRKEIAEFIRDCKTWGLDVIPLQQCFGHVEYILQHARYAGLREDNRDLCQLCPCKTEEALKVFSEIFSDIAAMHPSPFIHIGGDETYLLGNCPQCQ